MEEPRFQYEKQNVIKAIVENTEGKILLIQEPETNEWMPGHWGLPGGKPVEKESLYEAFKRKIKEELGEDLEPSGIFKIEELLIGGRTVFMYHVVCRAKDGIKPKGESKGFKWVGIEEIGLMDTAEFTEFFNKELLLNYLTGNRETVDFDLIETQFYYDMHENPEYKKWLDSGKKDDKPKG